MSDSFPVINSNMKLMNADGTGTPVLIKYFGALRIALIEVLSQSGVRPKSYTTAQQLSIINNGSKVLRSLIHDKNTNEYLVLKPNGATFRFEKILTQPLP